MFKPVNISKSGSSSFANQNAIFNLNVNSEVKFLRLGHLINLYVHLKSY